MFIDVDASSFLYKKLSCIRSGQSSFVPFSFIRHFHGRRAKFRTISATNKAFKSGLLLSRTRNSSFTEAEEGETKSGGE